MIKLSTVAWSPDGKLLLAGYRQDQNPIQTPEEALRVTLWDVKTGKRLQELKGHDGNICFVGFLPDSKRAVTAGGSTVKMWDACAGKQLWSAKPHARRTDRVALSPDGKFVLSWGIEDDTNDPVRALTLCDAKTGKLLRQFDPYKGQPIQTLRFAPDSKLAFIGWYPRLLDVTTGRISDSYKKGEEWKCPLAFSPDGKLALSEKHEPTSRQSAHLVLWNLANGKIVRRLEDYTKLDGVGRGSSHALGFTPDGKHVLSGDTDGRVRIWEAATGTRMSSIFLLYDYEGRKGLPHRLAVRAFSPDGKMALTSSEEKNAGHDYPSITFFLWDVNSGKLLREFEVEPGYFGSPDYNPDGP